MKQFHLYRFVVCSNEKEEHSELIFSCIHDDLRSLILWINKRKSVLIEDGAEAISNAFSEAFRIDHKIVMCWFHMRKNIEKKTVFDRR